MSPSAVVVSDGVATEAFLVTVRPPATSTGSARSAPAYALTNAVPPTAASLVHVKELSPAASTCTKTASAPVLPCTVRLTALHPAGADSAGWVPAPLIP